MSVWLAIPSKRSPEEAEPILKQWRERGYKIVVARDEGDAPINCDHLAYPWPGKYRGYATTVNYLCQQIVGHYPDAEWFICAGDDTLPDPNHSAEEIARECCEHFFDLHWKYGAFENPPVEVSGKLAWKTFGVCQPTGDRWHEGVGGFANAPIDRVAGSPWIGREFARRMYGGAGPYWHEYTHCFVDQELRDVAIKMGVYWERRDLIHLHKHWARGEKDSDIVSADRMPAFLAEANSPSHWRKFKTMFYERQAANFPGHEPCA